MSKAWPGYLKDVTLFNNAIRLRYLVWTIERYIPRGSRLLEVGFGSGTMAVLLADMGYHVTAIDIDNVLVDQLRHRYTDWIRSGRLDVQQTDMFNLPWQEKVFDLAYHQGVLEHFSDSQIIRALKEQARIAHWIIFDVPNARLRERPFGDERLLSSSHWQRLIRASELELVETLGRDFQRWWYMLPFVFFSHYGLRKWPGFSRRFGTNSIFVCRSRSEA